MKNFKFWWYRTFLFILFLSYYIIAIATNYAFIENKFDPFSHFKSKITQIDKNTFTGPYLNNKRLSSLKQKYHIKRVISLINPNLPILKELSSYEQNICKREKIKYINIIYSPSSKNVYKIFIITDLLKNQKKPTYIHGFLDDKNIGVKIKYYKNQ